MYTHVHTYLYIVCKWIYISNVKLSLPCLQISCAHLSAHVQALSHTPCAGTRPIIHGCCLSAREMHFHSFHSCAPTIREIISSNAKSVHASQWQQRAWLFRLHQQTPLHIYILCKESSCVRDDFAHWRREGPFGSPPDDPLLGVGHPWTRSTAEATHLRHQRERECERLYTNICSYHKSVV